MDPTRPKAPFCPRQAPYREEPAIMGGVSRSFRLSYAYPHLDDFFPRAIAAICAEVGGGIACFSWRTLVKVNTPPDSDSVTHIPVPLREGFTRASHLEIPTAPWVTAMEKHGPELMGSSSHSTKQALPIDDNARPWPQSQ